MAAALEQKPKCRTEAARRKCVCVGSARGVDIGSRCRTAGPDLEGDACGAAQATDSNQQDDPARLVFIDETAVSTNMVRLRGRAPRGTRVIGTVPLGAWETITFVGALRHNKMTAPMVIEGAMTGEMFLAYVEQCLVPTLRRNDIVVMDNCRVHLVAGIREAIEKARATLRYLPKYSPDLNPIELSYSKFKALLRKVAARTVPGLYRAIRSFVPQLGAQCLSEEFLNHMNHL